MNKDTKVDMEKDIDEESMEEVAPLTNWSNAPTLKDLKQDFNDAKADHGTIVAEIDTWIDNLRVEGSAKPKKRDNRSSVQPKVIRKQAEWRYPALSEPFLSTDDVFNVSPVTFEDKKAAEQNQLVLNNQFNTKMNKVDFIDKYVRTLVDEGTLIVQTGWVFEEAVREIQIPDYSYQENSEFGPKIKELLLVLKNDPEGYEEKIPKHLKEAVDLSLKTGTVVEPIEDGTKTIKRKMVIKNHPTAEIIDYQNIIIDPTCNGDIRKAKFVIKSFETSLSDLEKEGKYKNLDRIKVGNADSVLAEPDHISNNTTNFQYSDKPRKKIVAYEYWGFWDYNDTGIVEPFVCTWVGETMIRMEENPFPDNELPFIKVQYLPRKNRITGEPDGALLEDNQKIIGAVTRGMVDILARSANGQQGTMKGALDVTNTRKFNRGDDYQYNGGIDPRVAIYRHTFDEIPNSAPMMINMQNAEAESLTGVIPFNNGVNGNSLGDVAAGVRGALDAASKREMSILRRLAKGITEIGRKFISMNAVWLDEEEVVRITNEEFVAVRRDDLAGNFDLKLSISTAEEDNEKAKELSFMLQTVGPNSDPKMVYEIMADIAQLRKMPELAKRLREYEPQPDPLEQRIKQLEIEKLQAEIEEIRSRTPKNFASADLDSAKANTEVAKANNLESETNLNDLDFVEQESGVKQERELEKQGAQAEAQGKTKLLEAIVKN